MDQRYYEVVVKSYDSAKKRHLVCYHDGDKEILYMRNEKWYFVNESKLSKDEEANQTGCDEETSRMPQNKKAKTSKEQLTNKQSMMDIPPEMFPPFPRYVKKDDEVPQVSRRQAEQVLSSCASQLKKYLTETVKSSSLSLDKHSGTVDSICEVAFNALKQEEAIANENEEKQKATKVSSSPELTCVPKKRLNLEHSFSVSPHDLSVEAAISSIKEKHESVSPRRETAAEGGVKTQDRKTQQPVAEEKDVAESESQTHKRARVESCRLDESHGEMEKIAAEGEPCCRSRKKLPQPCSVTQQLAKVKQSILETIASLSQFRSELVTKEQSIVDTLSSVRQFHSEIQKKEDNLQASLLEIDVLGEKIMGINKILNSELSLE